MRVSYKPMKTVLNFKNVDTTKQPLFLGEDLNLQRYDRFKYPIFLWVLNFDCLIVLSACGFLIY